LFRNASQQNSGAEIMRDLLETLQLHQIKNNKVLRTKYSSLTTKKNFIILKYLSKQAPFFIFNLNMDI
jgi:hypothetical protein